MKQKIIGILSLSIVVGVMSCSKQKGQVTIYSQNYAWKIYIDDKYIGTTSSSYYSTPDCGADGCVNTELDGGIHDVILVSGSESHHNTIDVKKNQCNIFQIPY